MYQNHHQAIGSSSIQETSMKKYPNKYYKFENQDSSGRKFIRDELKYNQNDRNLANISKENQFNLYFKQNQKKQITNKIKNKNTYNNFNKKKNNTKKISNRSLGSQKAIKNKSCNQSVIQSIKWSGREQQCQQQLKHYKHLCLNMRKKNSELDKQLRQCKDENRKSILQLSQKVEKINVKCQQSQKDTQDTDKMQQILSSLKTIKGKLGKKQESGNQKRFYDFFIESLGVLLPQQQHSMNYLQLQVLWKQMLQFLILHDFKIEHKKNTIR